jgi:hypothetical protein
MRRICRLLAEPGGRRLGFQHHEHPVMKLWVHNSFGVVIVRLRMRCRALVFQTKIKTKAEYPNLSRIFAQRSRRMFFTCSPSFNNFCEQVKKLLMYVSELPALRHPVKRGMTLEGPHAGRQQPEADRVAAVAVVDAVDHRGQFLAPLVGGLE